MATYDELIEGLPADVAKAIEDVVNDAGTSDADWKVLESAGKIIADLRRRLAEIPAASPADAGEGRE